jgi:hypothetical protein
LPKAPDEDGETDVEDMSPDDWDDLFEDAARMIVSSQQGKHLLIAA